MHRLPAGANIIMTQQFFHFVQQVMSTQDRANKQAEMDVSMGDMLTEIQGCLKQLYVAACGMWQLCGDLLALPAPALYKTSGSISSVQLAWSDWSFGSTTVAERVKQIKADKTTVMGRRNSTLHRKVGMPVWKDRHLPQLIESMILAGASEATAVSLVVQMADHMAFTR